MSDHQHLSTELSRVGETSGSLNGGEKTSGNLNDRGRLSKDVDKGTSGCMTDDKSSRISYVNGGTSGSLHTSTDSLHIETTRPLYGENECQPMRG